ncbi:helix-turn-helix domain-containing protein [Parafrankia sp. FMc2]|uniref:helix-turn-helix domain-containing protein n=1 Tax=Parafrankia sp. FMc2 TaxID=3233196 RepID=UPI0034D7ABBC
MDWTEDAVSALYTDIGGRVRRARKRQGWSQVDLGRVVDLTRSSIANLEAGRQRPPVHVLLLIAKTLEVPVDALLPGAEDLEKIARIPRPVVDLAGQPDATHNFVTSVIRRATGGTPDGLR